ncbi:MAG: inositol monophosphatase [Alphaproteobacteria bacterium]|nr:inositol monophosphatase [Alphaproteobacteria bacterium]
MHELYHPVADLMRQVGSDIVMPRFQNLAAHQILEKAPDELVTIADKESEERLSEGLAAILPKAGIVGEEACESDPALLGRVGEGLNWIIDPIDGTGNFAAGHPPFGILIALADNGHILAGWILDPVRGRMCHGALGKGAFVDGEAVRARASGAPLPIAALATFFMTPEQRADMKARSAGHYTTVDIPRCAAEQYPRIVLGENDLTIFERSLPWDHAAGAIFLNEAGGRLNRTDGSPYKVGDARRGLLGAASPQLWDEAARVFFD